MYLRDSGTGGTTCRKYSPSSSPCTTRPGATARRKVHFGSFVTFKNTRHRPTVAKEPPITAATNKSQCRCPSVIGSMYARYEVIAKDSSTTRTVTGPRFQKVRQLVDDQHGGQRE